MELKEFVKKTLIELMDAVREAAAETKAGESEGVISPRVVLYGPQSNATKIADEDDGGVPFLVDFDLSVIVKENDRSKIEGSAKLTIASVFSLGAGGKMEGEQAKVATQRLRFSVPVKYPQKPQAQRPAIQTTRPQTKPW